MILNCPSCGAGFEVRAEALGTAGRRVRCSSCRHQWLARPPAPAAAPAPPPPPLVAAPPPAREAPRAAVPPPPPADVPPPLIAAEPAAPAPDITRLREAAILHPSAPPPRDAGREAARDSERAREAQAARATVRREAPPHRSGIAIFGWVLFVLIAAGLGSGVYFRDQIMRSWPQSRPIFQAFGFRVPSPTEGLLIDNIRMNWSRTGGDGRPLLVIEGRVNNLSDESREIPPLRGVWRNQNQQEVDSWTFSITPAFVASRDSVSFRTEVRPPEGAATAAIVFAVTE